MTCRGSNCKKYLVGQLNALGLCRGGRNLWPGNRWQDESSGLVCSRDQPVFQQRAVLCPLGIPTHAINQCRDAALKCTRQPHNTNERQILSTTTKLRFFFDGSRSLKIFSSSHTAKKRNQSLSYTSKYNANRSSVITIFFNSCLTWRPRTIWSFRLFKATTYCTYN